MDNKGSCLLGDPQALGIFKTIYLFLKTHNFEKAAKILREEWGLDVKDIENVCNTSLLLTRCRCSKSQANQTDLKRSARFKDDWLEGTFQGESFQVKPDETRIFYVCDHCQRQNWKHAGTSERRTLSSEKLTTLQSPSCAGSEAEKLRLKFRELQDDHQKLIVVTSELATALQTNIIGQTRSIHAVLKHCKTIYPSLFPGDSPQMAVLENDADVEQNFHTNVIADNKTEDGPKGSDNIKINIARASQFPESPEPQQENILRLNLENVDPVTPLTTPLTPETVRYILEAVFNRIFELERCKNLEPNPTSPPLNNSDVEKIVVDVLNEVTRSPLNCGAGEGEVFGPDSVRMIRNQNGFFSINYSKLKSDLIQNDNERKIRILQALRWRITKTDGSTREKVLESYVTNDILALSESISIPERLLLGYGVDHYVQESTCRLINTLASLRQGRDYLTIDERLLKRVLIKKAKDVRTVSGAVIRNMLIASVQKLSIRKQCRTEMVNEGLFEIMVDYLDEFYDKLSKYCLEYCSALLMNLCLVDEAKDRSTKNPKRAVGLLRKFLEGGDECYLPYINGVMFSLFEKGEIVNEATNQNLDKIIMNLIQVTNNDNIKKQLDFILQSRLFGRGDPSIHDDHEDSKEEVDMLEMELDQDDFITQLPSGENLLQEYKTDSGNSNVERSVNSVSFFPRRDPPNSAKSFCEETKQFLHKPSSERGIFEVAKPKRYTKNLIQGFVRSKAISQSCGRYSATPICYMEKCQRLLQGSGAQCSCSACTPGQSRYSCGCYEAIRRDVADAGDLNAVSNGYRRNEPKSSQLKLYGGKQSASTVNKETDDVSHLNPSKAVIPEGTVAVDNNAGGRIRSGCKVCGEKKCECAFESRPKLCRTPTL